MRKKTPETYSNHRHQLCGLDSYASISPVTMSVKSNCYKPNGCSTQISMNWGRRILKHLFRGSLRCLAFVKFISVLPVVCKKFYNSDSLTP